MVVNSCLENATTSLVTETRYTFPWPTTSVKTSKPSAEIPIDGPKNLTANTTPVQVKKKTIDYSKYRSHFLGVSVDKIKATFQATTQFATNIMAGNKILQTVKSPWPANNAR